MLISDEKQFIFVHISKTAGTSIRRALQPYALQPPQGKLHSLLRRFNLPRDYRQFKFGKHAFLREAEAKLPEKIYQDYLKFAVIRNPWDRLVSGFYSYRGLKSSRQDDKSYNEGISFEDYLERQYKRNNLQVHRLKNAAGKIDLDAILRFEQLNDDVGALCNKIGVDFQLDQANRSFREKRDFRDYYTETSRKFVEKHWAEDIEAFSYRFEFN